MLCFKTKSEQYLSKMLFSYMILSNSKFVFNYIINQPKFPIKLKKYKALLVEEYLSELTISYELFNNPQNSLIRLNLYSSLLEYQKKGTILFTKAGCINSNLVEIIYKE